MAKYWHEILPMREVNAIIRHESATEFPATEPLAFVCECERSACHATVWLTAAEYDDRVRTGASVCAHGAREAAPSLAA